ncbi:hypothetical protein GCM10023145_38990 [Angustibacter luteus]
MAARVRADNLQVGDVVVLTTASGDQALRIHAVIPRTATIKFVGRRPEHPSESAGQFNWGWPPDHMVELVAGAH